MPYSRPLMPLLADMGALDDLGLHINLSDGLFRRVNDEVLMLFAEAGCSWTATDEDVLRATLPDASHFKLYYADYGGRRIYVFFRDKTLSDNIGFRYSSMKPEEAPADFVNYLRKVPRDRRSVVVVALDGKTPGRTTPTSATTS